MPVAPHANRFTGLFRSLGPTPPRPHDPDVSVWAGVPANRPWPASDAAGGAGWTDDDAERACVGEAVERWQTHALPTDRLVRASYAELVGAGMTDTGLTGAAIDPQAVVRFSDEQYAVPGFPYEPLTRTTTTDWVRARVLGTGAPIWVPAELVFLDLRPTAAPPRFGPTISTGWAAHVTPQQALAAAVCEVIERDAVVGAWWGRYPVEELDGARVWSLLGDAVRARLVRPNLRWRWFHVVTPRAMHVTMATCEGIDREGDVFAIGSACRLNRRASLEKSALEAVQGRHYVRYLLATTTVTATASDHAVPTSFAEHAAFYSRYPGLRASTCLASATRTSSLDAPDQLLGALIDQLGRAAFRMATPPGLVGRGYHVVRLVAPALQPLHGDHRLPVLGGPLWHRSLAAYANIPPHPFA